VKPNPSHTARRRTVPKAERKRLAKAELLLNAAVTVQRWADDLTGKNPTAPMSEWGDDDPFVSLCRRYALTPADLAKIAEGLAEQLEGRAERAGYAEAWL
jgi:hypothetical protein